MTEANELAACPNPWCEESDPGLTEKSHGIYAVWCRECGIHGPAKRAKVEAIAAWNQRAPKPDTTPDEVPGARIWEMLKKWNNPARPEATTPDVAAELATPLYPVIECEACKGEGGFWPTGYEPVQCGTCMGTGKMVSTALTQSPRSCCAEEREVLHGGLVRIAALVPTARNLQSAPAMAKDALEAATAIRSADHAG